MDFIITIYTIMFFFGIYFLLLFILLYLKNKKEFYEYPKPKKFPYVSIITSAYNEEDGIKETIEAVMNLNYPKNKIEHIIVNDGSKDKTAEIVKKLMRKYKNLKLIDKENSGKADSLNLAIKAAKGEIIAVVDADSYPTPDSLMKMIGYFEDEKVGAVTSRVLVKNKKNFIEKFQAVDYIVIAWGRKILDFINCVYVTNGPLSLYKKKYVAEAGGFDPKNLTEDIEITWHLLSLGYKTKMSYATEVYTIVPNTLKKWIQQRIRWNLGGLQTINKYKKFFLRTENLFGYFVLNYVTLSFFFTFIGFLLLLRFILLKSMFYSKFLSYFFLGYNPFKFWNFQFFVSLLFILGTIFLVLSLIYYKFIMSSSEFKKRNMSTILVYVFIYRPLYLVPYLMALYKIIKRDIRWYTK
ncbi:MAG: glycosyltransferase [Candidatus Pacearchaeota archaeon]|nr:glycosyltransferase [Candidatus Pacearchaeota archaeon]